MYVSWHSRWGNKWKFYYDGSCDLDNDDLPSYEELSSAFNELHNEITSLCTKKH